MSMEKSVFRKIITAFAAVVLLAAVFPCAARRTTMRASAASVDNNYWFQRVGVDIEVRKDKTFAIREEMKVGFRYGGVNTGIIRDIQRLNRTTRIRNGEAGEGAVTGKKFLATLTDVAVTIDGEPARVTRSLYDNGNFYSIKMQKRDESYFDATDRENEDTFHTFVLSYVYGMRDDKVSGFDDFTFDVYGYAMATTGVVVANVVFPDELDESQVSFRTNNKQPFKPDVTHAERAYVTENRIRLVALPQTSHKGYTVQVILPDGYFQAGRTVHWYYFVFLALGAAAIAGGIALFCFFRSRKGIAPVEFAPPEDMSVMRFSAIWHGTAHEKDAPALILDWAAKGYVRIERDGNRDVNVYLDHGLPKSARDAESKTRTRGATKAERGYYNALFSEGEGVFSTRKVRRERACRPSFSRKLYRSVQELKTEAEKPSPMVERQKYAYPAMLILSLLPWIFNVIYTCILAGTAVAMFTCIFAVAGTAVGYMQAKNRITPILYVFPIAFMGVPLVMFSTFYIPMYDYAGLTYIAFTWWAVCLVLAHFFGKRTPEAQAEYDRLRGFKRFLLTAEESRLEMLFDERPDLFAEILPYCYIMKITKRVEKRFKALGIAAPVWTEGQSVYACTHAFSHAIASSGGGGGLSSGSGGGGGGGGGSSGGGGGGGGSRGC